MSHIEINSASMDNHNTSDNVVDLNVGHIFKLKLNFAE